MKQVKILTAISLLALIVQPSLYAKWDTLGAKVNRNGFIEYKIWSPDSSDVKVVVSDDPDKQGTEMPLRKIPDFTDEYGYKYTDVYTAVTPLRYGNFYYFKINGKKVRDPYGRMVVKNSTKGSEEKWHHPQIEKDFMYQAIDFSKVMDDNDFSPVADNSYYKNKSDAITYETHVVDFTSDSTSGVTKDKVQFDSRFKEYLNPDNTVDDVKGTFLGMTALGTTYSQDGKTIKTGVDHLKELGITHVHLQPILNFHFCHSNYNWGYDPMDFNVPQPLYSAVKKVDKYEKNGIGRIIEVQQMVDNFHKAGIRVVLDAVYNHTVSQYIGEVRQHPIFSDITKQYYSNNPYDSQYDMLNIVHAVDSPMTLNMVRDSMEYWTRIYHIDGFRVDMMQIHTPELVRDLCYFLFSKFEDRELQFFGELFWWTDRKELIRLANLVKTEIIPNEKIGASGQGNQYSVTLVGPASGMNPPSPKTNGYLFNRWGDPHMVTHSRVSYGIKGSIRNTKGQETLEDSYDPQFANFPAEAVNYVDVHDGCILWEIVKLAVPQGSDMYQKQIDLFASAILMTSQGVPYFYGGDEFLRLRSLEKEKDFKLSVNKVKWDSKIYNYDHIFKYYQYLINLKKTHPAFRLNTWEEVNSNVKCYHQENDHKELPWGVILTVINGGNVKNEAWDQIVMVYNNGNDYYWQVPDDGKPRYVYVGIEEAVGEYDIPDPKRNKPYRAGEKIKCGGTAVTVIYSKK